MTYDRAADLERFDDLDTEAVNIADRERGRALDAKRADPSEHNTRWHQRAVALHGLAEALRSASIAYEQDFPADGSDLPTIAWHDIPGTRNIGLARFGLTVQNVPEGGDVLVQAWDQNSNQAVPVANPEAPYFFEVDLYDGAYELQAWIRDINGKRVTDKIRLDITVKRGIPPVVLPAPDDGFRPINQAGKTTVLLSGRVTDDEFVNAIRRAGPEGIIAANPESGERAIIEAMGKWHDLQIPAGQQWLGLSLGRNEPRRGLRDIYFEDCNFGSRPGFDAIHTGFVTQPWPEDGDSYGVTFHRCTGNLIYASDDAEPRASWLYSPRLRDTDIIDCAVTAVGTVQHSTGKPMRNVYSRVSYTRKAECRRIRIKGLLAYDTCDACQLGPGGALTDSTLIGMTNWSAVTDGEISRNLVLAARDWDTPFGGRKHSAAGLQAWGSGTRINDNILLYQQSGDSSRAFAAIDPRNGSASGNVAYGWPRLHQRTDNPDPSEIRMLDRDPGVDVEAAKAIALEAAGRGLGVWKPEYSGQYHYDQARALIPETR